MKIDRKTRQIESLHLLDTNSSSLYSSDINHFHMVFSNIPAKTMLPLKYPQNIVSKDNPTKEMDNHPMIHRPILRKQYIGRKTLGSTRFKYLI